MNNICTSIEQSQKLIELGFDIYTADMHYVRKKTDFTGKPVDGKWSEPKYGNTNSEYAKYIVQNFSSYETLPAWSLSALLYLLNNPQLFNHDDNWKCDGYTCIGYWHDNTIDAVFEVVELEAEKFQKGAKRHGIRRNVIKNIEEL